MFQKILIKLDTKLEMHSKKITVTHFLAHLTIFWRIVLSEAPKDFIKLSYYLFLINRRVFLKWLEYKISIILLNFKKVTLDSSGPLLLMKRRTLKYVSQVFVMHLKYKYKFSNI